MLVLVIRGFYYKEKTPAYKQKEHLQVLLWWSLSPLDKRILCILLPLPVDSCKLCQLQAVAVKTRNPSIKALTSYDLITDVM